MKNHKIIICMKSLVQIITLLAKSDVLAHKIINLHFYGYITELNLLAIIIINNIKVQILIFRVLLLFANHISKIQLYGNNIVTTYSKVE